MGYTIREMLRPVDLKIDYDVFIYRPFENTYRWLYKALGGDTRIDLRFTFGRSGNVMFTVIRENCAKTNKQMLNR